MNIRDLPRAAGGIGQRDPAACNLVQRCAPTNLAAGGRIEGNDNEVSILRAP